MPEINEMPLKSNFYFRPTEFSSRHGSYKENTWVNRSLLEEDKCWLNLYALYESEWKSYTDTQPPSSMAVMCLIRSGRMRHFSSDGETTIYQPGDFVVRYPRKRFSNKDTDLKNFYSKAFLDEPLIRLGLILVPTPALEALLKLVNEETSFVMHCSEPDKVFDCLTSIKQEITENGGRKDQLENLLFCFLKELYHQKPTVDVSIPMWKALRFIAIHGFEKITLPELAAAAGVSERTLLNMFREKFGVSPGEYLICRRIENAKRLLSSQTLMIADVARICGFGNTQFFCRMFRARAGMTPHKFQSSFTGNSDKK